MGERDIEYLEIANAGRVKSKFRKKIESRQIKTNHKQNKNLYVFLFLMLIIDNFYPIIVINLKRMILFQQDLVNQR